MKIGEWDGIGRARALVQRQLGELGAEELATHVAINPDNGRQRILVATDIGLLDYGFGAEAAETALYLLRGSVHRWPSVRGLRLQADSQWDDNARTARSIWRLVAEEPRIELLAESLGEDRTSSAGLLDFARACFVSMDTKT